MESANYFISDEEKKFSGGVAVITGAGSGIGAGLAQLVARLGMTVIVADVSSRNAEKVAQEICSVQGKAESYTIDVTSPSDLEQLAEVVFAKYGSVRLLVNNAGIEVLGPVWEISPAQWKMLLDVNVLGVVNGLRAFIPRMLASGQECWIANVASQVSFCHLPTQGAYCVSKHALEALTECLCVELEALKSSIHVSSVIPGMVQTNVFDSTKNYHENESTSRYRQAMSDLMKQNGQSVDESAKIIIGQIAANQFWIPTHPAQADKVMKERAAFLGEQRRPTMSQEGQTLLKVWDLANKE